MGIYGTGIIFFIIIYSYPPPHTRCFLSSQSLPLILGVRSKSDWLRGKEYFEKCKFPPLEALLIFTFCWNWKNEPRFVRQTKNWKKENTFLRCICGSLLVLAKALYVHSSLYYFIQIYTTIIHSGWFGKPTFILYQFDFFQQDILRKNVKC